MAGVRLEFAQFGHFDYFKIYRNSVSTAIENLGEPIGSSSTMYYEDLTVESNQDYYYRAGVVRNSIEEFSGEFHVKTVVEFDPPYNLIVEFKNDETNRLELNWNLDGFIDEQRYYCSESPIDINNLPLPKAVIAGNVRTYVDTDIEIGKTYYVRVGSVKNGIEKISSQIICHAEKLLVFLPLVVDATDLGSLGLNWTSVGGVTFNADGANFTTHAQYIYQNSYALNFNNDFKISLEVKRTNSTNTYPAILDNDINGTWAQRMFTLSLGGQNAATAFRDKFLVGLSGIYDQTTSLDIVNNQFYQVELSRTANTIKLKVNNIEILSYINTDPINVVQFLKLGVALVNGANGQFKGCLRNSKIYDLST